MVTAVAEQAVQLLHAAFDPTVGSQMSTRIAVVGATGAVGREMLDTLARRDFPVG